jgi:uncharacterized protein (TIGR00251 family)
MIELRTEDDAVLLPVKVVPGASRTRFAGELDGRAKFAVAAPPERGKANVALIAFLAKKLGVRRQSITVQQGATSPTKVLRIEGVKTDVVQNMLSQ